jgi:polyvinyl alcohol dehydrogenase (cytochrome)
MASRHPLALLLLLWTSTSLATQCDQTKPALDTFASTGWGFEHHNHRLQTRTRIDAGNISGLKLSWAYGLANNTPRFLPLVTSDTVFIGDSGRGLVALDRRTGCSRWLMPVQGDIGSAIVPAHIGVRAVLVFNIRQGGTYVVDATDGELIWHAVIDDQPVPMYSGTPLVFENTVFVPLSSQEIAFTLNPFYGCCTTSGGLTAFELSTGKKRWHRNSIPDKPTVTGRHYFFVEEHGPSGAPVWGAPMLDAERRLVYFGTGQNYSHPTSTTSDAIFALDTDSGAVRWVRQFTAGDAYNLACSIPGHPNCPAPLGPDVDFGAPPILLRSNGVDMLIAGQKSGDVHAMNPDTGDVIWTQKLGRGGALGGVHWGMAASEELGLVYVPISDIAAMPTDDQPRPGLFARLFP